MLIEQPLGSLERAGAGLPGLLRASRQLLRDTQNRDAAQINRAELVLNRGLNKTFERTKSPDPEKIPLDIPTAIRPPAVTCT
jgi:hypothetical protein